MGSCAAGAMHPVHASPRIRRPRERDITQRGARPTRSKLRRQTCAPATTRPAQADDVRHSQSGFAQMREGAFEGVARPNITFMPSVHTCYPPMQADGARLPGAWMAQTQALMELHLEDMEPADIVSALKVGHARGLC